MTIPKSIPHTPHSCGITSFSYSDNEYSFTFQRTTSLPAPSLLSAEFVSSRFCE